MFAKLSIMLAVLIPIVSALTINTPGDLQSTGSATITWTTDPNDPPVFSVELVNEVFHNSFALANNIPPDILTLTLTLPVVPVGSGYTLEFVNVSDISDVFATSGAFSIAALSSTSSGTSSSSSSLSTSFSKSETSVSSGTELTTTTSGFGVTEPPSSVTTSTSASVSPSTTSPTAASQTPAVFNGASSLMLGFTSAATGPLVLIVLSAIATSFTL